MVAVAQFSENNTPIIVSGNIVVKKLADAFNTHHNHHNRSLATASGMLT